MDKSKKNRVHSFNLDKQESTDASDFGKKNDITFSQLARRGLRLALAELKAFRDSIWRSRNPNLKHRWK